MTRVAKRFYSFVVLRSRREFLYQTVRDARISESGSDTGHLHMTCNDEKSMRTCISKTSDELALYKRIKCEGIASVVCPISFLQPLFFNIPDL
jgi:hypothetical protein